MGIEQLLAAARLLDEQEAGKWIFLSSLLAKVSNRLFSCRRHWRCMYFSLTLYKLFCFYVLVDKRLRTPDKKSKRINKRSPSYRWENEHIAYLYVTRLGINCQRNVCLFGCSCVLCLHVDWNMQAEIWLGFHSRNWLEVSSVQFNYT
jgi:hypothetical protein